MSGSQGYPMHACMQLDNFRILGARSAEKSVDIKVKEYFDPSILL